jgi:hypothetical protein
MKNIRSVDSTSRRTILAGLGAGAVGLALTRLRLAAAQEATPSTAAPGHLLAGTWLWTNYPGYPDEDTSLAIHGEDGTYIDSGFGGRFIGIGEWRATGDRTADIVSITNERIDFDDFFAPPPVSAQRDLFKPAVVALWRFSVEIDETGNRLTSTGTAEIQELDGTVVGGFPYVGYAERLTLATGSDATPATE